MKLYGYWRSSCTWRVRIVLGLKGLDYEYVPVHLGGEQHGAEHRERNPMQQVPVLEIGDGGSKLVLGQSMAIVEYLEERYPEPSIFPATRVGRARARQIAETVNAGIQPLQNTAVLAEVERLASGQSEAWGAAWVSKGLAAVEALAATTAGEFLVGEAPGIADAFVVPQLFNARRFGLDVEAYPTLLGCEQKCEKLPAFEKAHPSRQVDAEPS